MRTRACILAVINIYTVNAMEAVIKSIYDHLPLLFLIRFMAKIVHRHFLVANQIYNRLNNFHFSYFGCMIEKHADKISSLLPCFGFQFFKHFHNVQGRNSIAKADEGSSES